ncbi:MAG: tRNA preQ1(34) S-adenosylmethionine ribosyltransferase-isomerase QueA [Acidobacteria bacterium]|nr:tRNA preQ1(34) S-adenosylmethionine ribosyltransferase-isomerase QueA [Acidobacteriota bacterium]
MLVSEFDFDLPDELIAQAPAARGASRLMIVDRSSGAVRHSTVAALPAQLCRGDVLVLNNTRVFAARLLGRRVPSGGAVECLLLERAGVDASGRGEIWHALMHPGQKLREGARVRFEGFAGTLAAEVLERRFFGRRVIRLWVERGGGDRSDDVERLIDALGHVPLPPYIRRSDTDADRERYQTVYASVRGSVAAPTAGLHFTAELLDALEDRGVERTEITLHVGYGTFKPVRRESVEHHDVDPERYVISDEAASAINRARADGRRVVAVGTTTTRALEDAAIRGAGLIPAGPGEATIFIYPGFRFQAIDGLLTNFHLPRSSLLMLVSAFSGKDQVLAAYRAAVAERYRFYSYGDAMLIT